MAFWRKKETEMEQAYAQLEQSPGLNPTELAQRPGVASSTVQRRLPGMTTTTNSEGNELLFR